MAKSKTSPSKSKRTKTADSGASASKPSVKKTGSTRPPAVKKSAKAASRAKKSVAGKTASPKKKASASAVTNSAGKVAKGQASKAAKSAKRSSSAKRASGAASTKRRNAAVDEDDGQQIPPKPIPKTRLKEEQLAEFRQLLLTKREELVGDVDHLTSEALHRSRSEAAGDLSSMPIHMADIGTDNWEQEFTLGLIDTERTLLREIDEALGRLSDRTYGVCQATHKPITMARLRAKPWAKYCIQHARLREQGRAT